MYPGNEADCQTAMLHYRALVAEGQHQQFVAGVRPGPVDTLSATTTLQQRLGILLMRAGRRLLGLHTVTTQSFDTVATGERAAIACVPGGDPF